MRFLLRWSCRSSLLAVLLSVSALFAFSGEAAAQKGVKLTPIMQTENLTWEDIDGLPPGAKFAVLAASGDWHVVRVKLPPHYVIPPHSHPNAEALWLISGRVGFGFGEKVDMSSELLKPGAFFAQPGGQVHYVWTGDEGAIFDVQVSEPEAMMYVNPADDPHHKM